MLACPKQVGMTCVPFWRATFQLVASAQHSFVKSAKPFKDKTKID